MAVATVNLEVADIQGLVVSGYRRLAAADYVLLRIADPDRARRWLGKIAPSVTNASAPVTTTGVNLALTATGLEGLGLDQEAMSTFPAEFVEGMATSHRSRMLGDVGDSAPTTWRWGGDAGHAVDALLMLFAVDAATLVQLRADQPLDSASGLEEIATLHSSDLGGREQFGFNDGISQPTIAGLGRPAPDRDLIQPGEFVLGYPNEYGLLPPSPSVGGRDIGRNGTYLVFRQMRQDVAAFWNFAAASGDGEPEKLAAKMVGRWTSGAPLVMAPDADQPNLSSFNDFAYHALDSDGVRCPIASHVRRTNPRDSLDPARGSHRSVALVKRHRLLRRGREYGPPISSAPGGPRPPLADDGQDRGLHFICLNANLVRQFEFVQATWAASPKFAGLYDDADPLIAARDAAGATFDVPATPLRHRLHNLPRFVTVVGGAYFFLPGIDAIRRLAAP